MKGVNELYAVFSDKRGGEVVAGRWIEVACLEEEEEEEECDCVITWVKKKKKKVGSDLLESRRTEGAPVDFISSLVKAEANITHSAPSEASHEAFMNDASLHRDAHRHHAVERSTQHQPRSHRALRVLAVHDNFF